MFRLKPGHFMKVDSELNFHVERYYRLNVDVNHSITHDEACHEIRSRLKAAVERQMISDVPIGLYLSGGIDSGSLVATQVGALVSWTQN